MIPKTKLYLGGYPLTTGSQTQRFIWGRHAMKMSEAKMGKR